MFNIIARGFHATVYGASFDHLPSSVDGSFPGSVLESGGQPGVAAVKIVNDDVAFMKPHSVAAEVRLLRRIDHPNVVRILRYEHDAARGRHVIILPLYPITLVRLLDNPHFCPRLPSTPDLGGEFSGAYAMPLYDPLRDRLEDVDLTRQQAFTQIATRLSFQLISALACLHGMHPPIAHRDIKPINLMLDRNGDLRVIDLGIGVEGTHAIGSGGAGSSETMRCQTLQVGSGAYRAPELIFGAEHYSPFAIDVWAAGMVIASMFTPLQYRSENSSSVVNVDNLLEDETEESLLLPFALGSSDKDSSSDEDDSSGATGIVTLGGITRRLASRARLSWRRQSLFEGALGDIGLAWSIFRIKGTPTAESWPDFDQLADAGKISFLPARGVALRRVMPFLSDFGIEEAAGKDPESVLQTLTGMLDYSAERRWSARKCLNSAWFKREGDLSTQSGDAVYRQLMAGFLES